MPCTPTATNASRTSSSLNGLITAMTSFMNLLPECLPTLSARWRKIKRLISPSHGSPGLAPEHCSTTPPLTKEAALPQQPLLSHGGNERSVPGKNETTGKAARTREIRAVMGVEQPFVCSKRAVKPKRVIEACRHQALFEHGAPMRDQRRIEQQHVGCVGENALMNCGLIWKRRRCPDPDVEAPILDFFSEIAIELHGPPFDWPFAFVIAPHRIGHQR